MRLRNLHCLQHSDCGVLSGRTPLHLSSLGGHLGVCQFLMAEATKFIAAALQHQVHEDGSVVWTATPQRRLGALNVLAQLPAETPLSYSVAHGVLRSCLVAEADVAAAALRCGRLSVAIEAIPRAEALEWLAQSVHARVGCPVIRTTWLHNEMWCLSRVVDARRLFAGSSSRPHRWQGQHCDSRLRRQLRSCFAASYCRPRERESAQFSVHHPALHRICAKMHSYYFFILQRSDSGIHSGETPLHWSSKIGRLGVCQFLVEKGANVNATDIEYDTHANVYERALLDFLFL